MSERRHSIKTVCVYAASSAAVAPVYLDAAARLGELLVREGFALIYGAGKAGVMGALAHAVHAHGGHVTGVIPEKLRQLDLAYEDADELIVTRTLRERKAIMEERADAFVALPGGFGTLEEIAEVLALKQLEYHEKPLVFLNTNGIYDALHVYFETLIKEKFIREELRGLYHFAKTSEETVEYLRSYEHEQLNGIGF
jgi:cytokinin riboside 5'-monophosphate phosphoribohydrolase